MFMCPVCGYAELDFNPEAKNFDICPCCGTEFGYSDFERGYAELRADWVARSAQWWSEHTPPPPNWDAVQNLLKVRGR